MDVVVVRRTLSEANIGIVNALLASYEGDPGQGSRRWNYWGRAVKGSFDEMRGSSEKTRRECSPFIRNLSIRLTSVEGGIR